jgi:hypothetical protein
MFKKIIDYYKDNPQGYWFKRKLYGWGWTPVKWQGWLIILLYIVFLIAIFGRPNINAYSFSELSINLSLPFLIATGILIFICYKKGEKPKWQWGVPRKDQ